ncbi:phosphate ABC transporter substrate-binding protein [Saccharobesus litoralis]|uniref:Phosphate ABC transporter substrate-binding protein n=1 Tax=Saccharobesus litoralis TaxID=2172099 RepID=A0A2S0VV06_9ALTE|nr:substrate-binding domain-containing protein [Saccharobesus litoralis]AWB68051.1 phosphate ABC transporter substrate-binding protein [Saccharobesus litoralis]
MFRKILTIAIGCISFSVFSLSAEVAIIVNPSVADNLDRKQISRIFMGKDKAFPSGSDVIPFNLNEGSGVRNEFEKMVIQRSPAQINAYWGKYVFTGKGTPPDQLKSEADVIAKVKSSPNAIGYIDAKNVTPDVKVIATF